MGVEAVIVVLVVVVVLLVHLHFHRHVPRRIDLVLHCHDLGHLLPLAVRAPARPQLSAEHDTPPPLLRAAVARIHTLVSRHCRRAESTRLVQVPRPLYRAHVEQREELDLRCVGHGEYEGGW